MLPTTALILEYGDTEMAAGYEEWLTRMSMTYDAVVYCCRYRLGDERQAAEVGLAVAQGLLAKPRVFKYFGLPYSARVARLAERKIAEIRSASTSRTAAAPVTGSPAASWVLVVNRLRRLPKPLQEIFVLCCVEGWEISSVAGAVRSSEETVSRLLAEAANYVRSAGHHWREEDKQKTQKTQESSVELVDQP
jgi:hypothetical protein